MTDWVIGLSAAYFRFQPGLTLYHSSYDVQLAVSGLKGDRVYYRKVALACSGTTWRHIAFEYPVAAKPVLDRLVERASGMFDRLAEDSCAGDLLTHPKS